YTTLFRSFSQLQCGVNTSGQANGDPCHSSPRQALPFRRFARGERSVTPPRAAAGPKSARHVIHGDRHSRRPRRPRTSRWCPSGPPGTAPRARNRGRAAPRRAGPVQPRGGAPIDSAAMGTPAVEVTDLVKRYGETTAVAGLSFTAPAGAVTALLGPNGAGKTSTVEICEGFRRADAGTVRVLGMDPVADAARLKPRVGVMLQSGGVPTGARAGEWLRLMASFHARPIAPESLLERLGLASVARTPFRRLSGGQQQRLSLAAAVIGRPEAVFLDEPTAGLDPQARRATWDLVAELRDAGVAVLLTTHYMEEAERLADRVVIIDGGRVVADGSTSELT